MKNEKSRATESFLPKILHWLQLSGFLSKTNENERFGFLLRRYALHALRTVIVVQSALLPVISWRTWDLELRVVWLEEISCQVAAFSCSLNFYYSKTNANAVMLLMRPVLFYNDENEEDLPISTLSDETASMVEHEDAANLSLLVSTETIFNLVTCSYSLKPIFRILIHWLGIKPLDAAALPVMGFNPFVQPLTPDVTEVSHLLVLSLIQLIYLYDCMMSMHASFEGLFLCIGNIVTDMKALRYELREMTALVGQQNLLSVAVEENDVTDWMLLRRKLRQVCHHHQGVFRKVKQTNEIFTFPILFLDGFCCIYVCLGVYCVVNGELATITTHCVPTLMIIFFCHIFVENGQRIETEGENLRLALYDCYVGYQSAPPWYHRSLLMMMLRHYQPPSLGPFRIFSLNRTNFKVIIQAAMSYFNILNNLAE